MKLSLKSNVQLTNLQPQMIIALQVVLGVYEAMNIDGVMITSANDSVHGPNSLHYKGKALDFRTNHIYIVGNRIEALEMLRTKIASALVGFDVIMEDIGSPNEHLHIEYDPKYPSAPQAQVA